MRDELGCETKLIQLAEVKFKHCEGYYSKAAPACTWPCTLTQMDAEDELEPVYEALVHWADVVLVATPIRWGAASSLYFKLAERLNCVQNQVTLNDRVLIQNKVASFIIPAARTTCRASPVRCWGSSANWASPFRSSRSWRTAAVGPPKTWRTMFVSCKPTRTSAKARANSLPARSQLPAVSSPRVKRQRKFRAAGGRRMQRPDKGCRPAARRTSVFKEAQALRSLMLDRMSAMTAALGLAPY